MAYANRFSFPTSNADLSGGTSRTSISQTGGSSVVVGDRIIVGIVYANADHTVTMGSSLSNIYNEITSAHWYDSTTTVGMRFFECTVTNPGTEVLTATYDSASLIQALLATVYSGLAGAVDVVMAPRRQTGVGTGAGAIATNAGTVASQPVGLFGCVFDLSAANGDGMTPVTATTRVSITKTNGLGTEVATCDQRITANGSTTQTWTAAQAGSDYYTVAFAIAEGGGGGGATSLYVQSTQANPTAASSTLTLTGVQATHTILAGIRLSSNSDLLSGVSSSINGAFSPIVNTNNAAASLRLYVLKLENVSAGSHTITINFSGTQSYRWFVAEYAAAFVDAVAASPNKYTATTTPVSPSVSSTVLNDTIVSIIMTDSSTAGISPGGSATEREEVNLALQLQDYAGTAIGSYSDSWVLGSSSAGVSTAIAMKANSALPAPLPGWSKQTFVNLNYIQY